MTPFRISRTIIAFAIWMAAFVPSSICLGDDASVTQLDQLVAEQKWPESIALGRELAEQTDVAEDLTLPFARLARGLQNSGDLPTASEFYQRAVDASERPTAQQLGNAKIVLVRLAAASVLIQTQQLQESVAALRPTLAAESGASDAQRQMAVTIALRAGASSLAKGTIDVATEAYALALKHADERQTPTAMLGDAWTTAVQNGKPVDAARKLAEFVDRFPEHADAPRAARACAECLKQSERDDDATAMLADLINRWPDSDAAAEVIRGHSGLAIDLVPIVVRDWLMKKAKADDLESLDSKTAMLGLLIATQQNELTAWANLAKHLAKIDQSGQVTSDTLATLTEQDLESDAERLATAMIAPSETHTVTPAAREAACRWAGRTSRWSMLAIASESEELDGAEPGRSLAVERLFAESLMQTGRVQDAHRWWTYLVDTRHSTDFATLLRCAESETAVGNDVTRAATRIAAARDAAEDNEFGITLVNMLESELAIRRSQFDHARGLLEHVVRSSETDRSLRGRAQWLIGETFYLQQKFPNAIEAYRRVEGIDPGGMWVSASLIQAGKSFEQLGRTRDAAVCYGNLLSRFADTAHADLARRRLAAISPGQAPNHPSSSQPTIRR
ncbi:MAG: tetratricopeptide repeat protein [Rubripirellula sp.]